LLKNDTRDKSNEIISKTHKAQAALTAASENNKSTNKLKQLKQEHVEENNKA